MTKCSASGRSGFGRTYLGSFQFSGFGDKTNGKPAMENAWRWHVGTGISMDLALVGIRKVTKGLGLAAVNLKKLFLG